MCDGFSGTGWSTAQSDGYGRCLFGRFVIFHDLIFLSVADEDQVGRDFVGVPPPFVGSKISNNFLTVRFPRKSCQSLSISGQATFVPYGRILCRHLHCHCLSYNFNVYVCANNPCIPFKQPYITKTYFGSLNPPVNLKKIAIGDGVLGSLASYNVLPVVLMLLSLVSPHTFKSRVFYHR